MTAPCVAITVFQGGKELVAIFTEVWKMTPIMDAVKPASIRSRHATQALIIPL
jgi:hypothetical protein